jgi:hypothetical protein
LGEGPTDQQWGDPAPYPGAQPPPAGSTPPSYQQPVSQPWAASPQPPTNGLAVTSLVLGIISWTPFLWVGFVPALIVGFIAKGQIDSSGGTQSGRGLAIAGIVLGLVGSAIMAFFFLLFVLGTLGTLLGL